MDDASEYTYASGHGIFALREPYLSWHSKCEAL